MAIYFVNGDLLASQCEALVNPVNCHGVMGAGLALQFKKAFPLYYENYRQSCLDGVIRPGRVNVYQREGHPTIVNFPTKNHWKDKSTYDWIEKGLSSLAEAIRVTGVKSIAIPMIGCGLGGLDWAIVREMIVQRLSHLHDCKVYIYGSMV